MTHMHRPTGDCVNSFVSLLYRELKDGSLCDNNIQDESNLTLVLHTETGVRVSDPQLVLFSGVLCLK